MYAIYDFLKAHGLKRSEERRERREFRRVMSFYESGRADAFDQDIEDRDLAHAHAVTLSKRIELSGDVSRDLLEETSAARPVASRRARAAGASCAAAAARWFAEGTEPVAEMINSESLGLGPGRDARDRFYRAVDAVERDSLYDLRRELAYVGSRNWARGAVDARARSLFHLAVQHDAHVCAAFLYHYAGVEAAKLRRGGFARACVEAAAADEAGTTTGDFYAGILRDADGGGGDGRARSLDVLGLDDPATPTTAARDPARGPLRSLRTARRGSKPRQRANPLVATTRRYVGLASAPSDVSSVWSRRSSEAFPKAAPREPSLFNCIFCADTGERDRPARWSSNDFDDADFDDAYDTGGSDDVVSGGSGDDDADDDDAESRHPR
ncbi:hypothetical protein SO694_00015454 [Aureococcus anophagefferens]|uniref:LisH domain-containing protein n=1 Tax=Aureococcus anophagefferens TaxID=44056 RepID=A0ABR1G2K7_AURAN